MLLGSLLLEPSVVSGDLKIEEAVVLHYSASDIVNHEWGTIDCSFVGNDHDMRAVCWDQAGHKVSRAVIPWVLRNLFFNSPTFEKCSEVRNPTVIDISVRTFEPPDLGILEKVSLHILVHQFL